MNSLSQRLRSSARARATAPRAIALSVFALSIASGCDEPAPTSNPDASADVAVTDVAVTDVALTDVAFADVALADSAAADASTDSTASDAVADAASDVSALDATSDAASDAAADAALPTVPTAPIIVSLSADGPDRFYGVAFDQAGHIYAVGQAAPNATATADFATVVARFDLAGRLDATFGTGGVVTQNLAVGTSGELARGIVVQSTGKVVVCATVEHAGAADARDRDIALLRLNADGTRDTSFGSGGVASVDLSTGVASGASFVADSAWGLAVQPDDKLVISGSQRRAAASATDSDFAAVRLTADGARDTTFGAAGVFTLDIGEANASARSIAVLPSGQIVGAGYMAGATGNVPVVYRLTSAGALDTSFGTGGYFSQGVLAAQTETYSAVLQGARLVTTGYGRATTEENVDWLSLRLTASGALDATWGTGGYRRVDFGGFADNSRQLLALPDERVLLFGGGRPAADNVDGALALLTANGALDTSFGAGGKQLIDLGGAADFLWAGALSTSASRIALVGVRGVATGGTGNDDAALVIVSMPR